LVYREYAPGAKAIFLTGDFNAWNRKEHELKADSFGNWEIRLPLHNKEGNLTIELGSIVKAHVLNANSEWVDRIPVWTRRVI
jgi:1,4-alpha-glucan branching enzyme